MSLRHRPSMLAARGVRKRFGRKIVLEDASLEVAPGEAVALVGENGAGKTTLLRICAGMVPADRGEIEVGGRIGYCPQEPGVFDLLTAEEHLVLFGRGLGLSRERSLAAGRAILAEFDYPFDERSVARDLSGGTRQKLNLTLSLLGDPRLLLMDEPYQGFDRGTYVNFWDHVARWRDQGRAVVVVTHMLAELDRVDRVVELSIHHSRATDRAAAAGSKAAR
jgi:ABC-2 type transport system ATP-binding protein